MLETYGYGERRWGEGAGGHYIKKGKGEQSWGVVL